MSFLRAAALGFAVFCVLVAAEEVTEEATTTKAPKKKFLFWMHGDVKMLLFWGTLILCLSMGVFIVDNLYTRWKGPLLISNKITRKLTNLRPGWEADARAFLASPTRWTRLHPVRQGATLQWTRSMSTGGKQTSEMTEVLFAEPHLDCPFETEDARDGLIELSGKLDAATGMRWPDASWREIEGEAALGAASSSAEVVEEGDILELRHRAGQRGGSLYCRRVCTRAALADTTEMELRWTALELGCGTPFNKEDTSTVIRRLSKDAAELELESQGACPSRLMAWWNQVRPKTQIGLEWYVEELAKVLQ